MDDCYTENEFSTKANADVGHIQVQYIHDIHITG